MTAQPSLPDRDQPWVIIVEEVEDYAFANLFRIRRARLQFRRFDGRISHSITRICFERGDSVGVLLHDPGQEARVEAPGVGGGRVEAGRCDDGVPVIPLFRRLGQRQVVGRGGADRPFRHQVRQQAAPETCSCLYSPR